MSAVMEREQTVPAKGEDAAATVLTNVSRKSHQFVEMLISEGQAASQEEFASAAYQAHYERIRDKMFGKKAESPAKKTGPGKRIPK